MLLTHRHLPSPDGLIPAMCPRMWEILGIKKGEGSAEDAPTTGGEETPNAPHWEGGECKTL